MAQIIPVRSTSVNSICHSDNHRSVIEFNNKILKENPNKSLDVVYMPLLKDPNKNESYPTCIPRLAYNLLVIIRDDYLVNGLSERHHESLATRFDCHPANIRKAWSYLNDIGFTISKPGGKARCSKRWITFEGFSFLDNQLLHQTLHYNPPIPYIDLFQKEELKDSSLLEEQQIGGQVEKPMFDEQNDFLDELLTSNNFQYEHRDSIRTAFNQSQLSHVSKKSLLDRIDRALTVRDIESPVSYFMASLLSEEKKQAQLSKLFLEKGYFTNLNLQC